MRNRRPLVTPQHTALMAARAHGLRGSMTPSETTLWSAIRANQLGVAFRRQVVVGHHFIADFLAPTRRLIVEVDGGVHALRRAADARRDRKLERLGFRVLRLDAELVQQNLPEALARIREALA